MSQVCVGGRMFLIVRYKGNRHYTVSELCTKREAGCKRGRHWHMVSECRTDEEARALLEEAYGDKQPDPVIDRMMDLRAPSIEALVEETARVALEGPVDLVDRCGDDVVGFACTRRRGHDGPHITTGTTVLGGEP